MECLTHLVGIIVGVDHYGGGLTIVGKGEAAGKGCHIVILAVDEGRLDEPHLGAVGGVAGLGCGQQSPVYAQDFGSIVIGHGKERRRRTVVDVEVVDMVATALAQQGKGVALGAHKGEDGLLGVAEIHHHALATGDGGIGDEVDDGHLHGVEVLNLVDLDPAVARIVVVGSEGVVGEQEQILKVDELVLTAVGGVGVGIAHLAQGVGGKGLGAHIEGVAMDEVAVVVGVVVDMYHGVGGELATLGIADGFESAHIVGTDTVGMEPQPTRMKMDDLVHEVGKLNNLSILATAVVALLDGTFFLVLVTGKDAQGIVVVDDRGLCLDKVVLEEETGTESMDVADIELAEVGTLDVLGDALAHAAGSAVGKGEAEHVAIGYALVVGTADALGKYLGLAAARGRQHQVVTA